MTIDFGRYPKNKYMQAANEIKAHFPYRSFKTYYDHHNFLLTNFRETDFHNAVAILESYDGSTLLIENCNCGYGGTGPNNTVSILELIGIPKALAENLVFNHNAVEFSFNSDGSIIENRTNLIGLFESREQNLKDGQIFLPTITYADIPGRTMYIVSPKGNSLNTFIHLLRIMKPTTLSYYIGMDNDGYVDLSPLQLDAHRHNKNSDFRRYSYIMVKGDLFDVVCLTDKQVIKSLINFTSIFFHLPLPYQEVEIGNITLMVAASQLITSEWDKLNCLKLLFTRHEDVYCSTPLNGGAKHAGFH